MKSDFNLIILSGNLTKDPDIRFTPSGKKVANISLAVNRFYPLKNQQEFQKQEEFQKQNSQEFKKETFFINVIAWNFLADKAQNNFLKGSKILVQGRLQIRKYETTAGEKRSVTEIIAASLDLLYHKKEILADGSNIEVPFGEDESDSSGELDNISEEILQENNPLDSPLS